MAEAFTPQDVRAWLHRRPGTFEADTENRCWDAAFRHFEDGRGFGGSFAFQVMVGDAGFDVRPTALGGYILDVKR